MPRALFSLFTFISLSLFSHLSTAEPVIPPLPAINDKSITPTLSISLNKPMLTLASTMLKNDDPTLADAISKLTLVRGALYKISAPAVSTKLAIDQQASALLKKNWMQTAAYDQKGQYVKVLSFTEGDNITGLVILIADIKSKSDGLGLFVQTTGIIDPVQIAYIASLFKVDIGKYIGGVK